MAFKRLGTMIDCSRNAVMKKEAVKNLNVAGFSDYVSLDGVVPHQSGEVSECLAEE